MRTETKKITREAEQRARTLRDFKERVGSHNGRKATNKKAAARHVLHPILLLLCCPSSTYGISSILCVGFLSSIVLFCAANGAIKELLVVSPKKK